jgi:sugar (pentulose or hexulose) kinase
MANGTGLYDLARRDWDVEMLRLSCLTTEQLSPLRDRLETTEKPFFPPSGTKQPAISVRARPGRAWSRSMSARGRPGCRHLKMLPSWVGELAPTWPENLTGTVVGLSQATTAADLWRAAFSAVSFRLAEIFEQLEGALGRPKKIVLSDGILQSPALLRFVTARS